MSDRAFDHDFDTALRAGLLTLAREAVHDADAAVVEDLPRVQHLPPGHRRPARRALAAVVAVVVIGASVAIAVAVSAHGKRSTLVENPQPSWTKLATGPLVARSEQSAVFTGHEVVVWGGRSDPSGAFATPGTVGTAAKPTHALADGATYNVATGHWRALPAAPFGPRYDAVAVWTGTEMIIVGGQRDGTGVNGATEFLRDGAAYDAAHNRWRRIPDAPGCPSVGTWTGSELVVGGPCADNSRSFAAFNPARDAWTNVPTPPGDASQLVSIRGRVFAWNGTLNRGYALDASFGTWTGLPAYGIPQQTLDSVAIAYGGTDLAVAGMTRGSDRGPDLASIALLDPGGAAWHHYESDAVGPPDTTMAAADSDVLIWPQSGGGYGWFTGTRLTGEFGLSNAGRAPISLDRNFESLVGIGGRRFFVWGGRLSGTSEDPTNRPVNDGAILELP